MANIRYSVPCPSCEAEVPIRNTAEIGKKKECPKCKYRFTVPEPPSDAGGDDAADTKTVKKAKKDKKKAKSGNGLLIGVVLGVLALGGLGTAGYFLFGGDDAKPAPVASSRPAATTPVPSTPAAGDTPPAPPADGDKPADAPKPEGGDATKPADGDAKPAEKPADKPKAGDDKDVTNLLPNDTRAVYRVNMDRLKQSATPLYSSVFDNYIQGLFQTSLTIPFDEVQTYIHCVVDPDREPFGVVRTKTAIDRARLYQALELEKPLSLGAAKREYFLVKSNPFIEAVGKAFTLKAVIGLAGLGDTIRLPDPPPADPKVKPKKYALCVYDSTTLFIGSEGAVERFLTIDMQDNGYPTFKSELTPTEPPPADPAATPPAEGGGPPAAGPGGVTPGLFSFRFQPQQSLVQESPNKRGGPPSAFGGEGGPPGAQRGGNQPRANARKLYTSVPTYRTIEPALKRLLNQLEEDEKNPPAVVYAELIDQRLIAARQAGEVFRATANPLAGLASRVQLIGGVLSQFDKDKGTGRLALEFVSDEEARKSVGENVRPLLNLLKLVADASLKMTTTISGGGTDTGGGFGGDQGPAGLGGEGIAPGGPPGGGEGGRGGPPPGFGGRGRPGFGGEGGFEGPGGGVPPVGPTGTFLDDGKGTLVIGQTDRVVTVTADMNWPEDKFREVLLPRVQRTGGQVRGRIAVQSGDADWHSLAAAAAKIAKDKKPFPRGTLERELKEERYRLPFPPEQRVSFLAELLPYLGRAGLRQQIQEKKGPWWSKDNIGAAETWVPEFLVPYYPQESWRASHPKADGKELGGTNYVAPAGLGVDSARFDPSNPDHAKKVGITGYDWGSKPEEVTDGLSNTIYLLQVPPDSKQAWIAGGGSTVRGVDDKAADPMADYTHRAPDGRRGTYALMADGSVRWLPAGTSPAVFKGLVTRAGGETLGDLDKAAPLVKPTRKDNMLKGGGLPAAKPAAEAKKIDADELKKFQGKWKVTYIRNKMLSQMAPGVDILTKVTITLDFDGTTLRSRLSGDNLPAKPPELPNQTLVRLDPSASPKVLDAAGELAGKNVTGEAVYEWVGANKVKMRQAEPGKPRPTSLAIPDDKSTDSYIEMERIEE